MKRSGIALARISAPVLGKQKLALLAIGVCILAAGLFQFAPPLLMGRFLAVLIGASHAAPGLQAYRELTLLFVAIALSVVAILGFQYAANRAGQWLSTVVGVDIRARLHGAVLDLGFGKQRELDAGTLQTRIVADTATIETLFSVSLPTMAIQTIFVGGAVALLVVRAPFLAPIVVVPLATVLAAALLARRATERLIAESAALAGALAARIAELGNGASAIRLSGRHAHQQRLFDDVAARAVAVQRRLWRYTGGFQHVLILNVSLCSYLMWYVGGMNALRPHGPIAVSDLIAFVPIVLLLFQPVYSLAAILDTIPKSLAAAQRIAAILDAPSEHAGGIESVPAGGSLRLEDVWFGYVDGIDVLRGCSFAVAPGEFVALTGPSGAGKSTIVNLLARLYEPRAGSVRWGHARASDIAPRSWRRAIGVVAQETFLFAESVRDNIRCGRDWIGDDAVEAAARAANADAFIRALPAGYDTPLGDAGAALSGGERQRLGIARALAGDPLLLLFDEPTAALDAETEAAFLDGLERARRGRTVVMVAHRPSAIARADRVLRLRDGRIAEGLRATRAV